MIRTEKWPPVMFGGLIVWLLTNPNLTLLILAIESVNGGPADTEDFTDVTLT